MLAISCLCFVPDFIIINYKVILNNIVKPIFKIFYDLTLYLKFERPLLNYFTTTPLIISKKWPTFSPSNTNKYHSLCLEE